MPPRPRHASPRRFANPLHGVDHVDYKDVRLLRTFISDRGKIRSRRVTRVTARQQRLIARAIKNAREMALLPYPSQAPGIPRGKDRD
ncbi:30S ribosomal protein S18 [Marinitenerispora sediminis]|uniref:Small ribosomal subunit protein bS18 n=1 Tax=Marinitenerispora sediminis TaxID=1931232 RepID=A0A368SZT5_9ACTN|nr:30S ribosomal protein S18 [Marinitenerispora sediminis]RCV51269.1 30S ribosomal protein S18 [Marinitenerispora sediminis]RCV52129.1 30S ribosomal protein S18 [Marinitenerispora sediminis]RCV57819.1 30S ribosomal protein S18 [Marinitenerispora sediminis]